MTRIFLRKNDLSKNPKLPYFTLCAIPESDGDEEWKEIGVLWKAKTGNGYVGHSGEDVVIDYSKVKSWKEKEGSQD